VAFQYCSQLYQANSAAADLFARSSWVVAQAAPRTASGDGDAEPMDPDGHREVAVLN